ncbi:hypothetical protein CEF21_13850 [Bacillus sp. FJAT-42376]|uniref:hypothetical protein n=1 Tax=Bacillus sp. FJAT-42376 TaxID=2014076 RepID=UPI000F4DA104|nr:hypothetical protein [Bacillus sp. FJAT-42376]AZB43297.1 hypothetical protein CEF21_13850 [Bacillus sp. FJAT-42376]
MEKLIDRSEIEELLKEIEEDMRRLEEKMGTAIMTESNKKELSITAKTCAAMDTMDNIEYTARLASAERVWPGEISFGLNT